MRARRKEMDENASSGSNSKVWSPVLWVLGDVIIILLKDVTNPVTLIALWWLLLLIYYLYCSKHTLLKAKPNVCLSWKLSSQWFLALIPAGLFLCWQWLHVEVCLILMLGREVCCRAGWQSLACEAVSCTFELLILPEWVESIDRSLLNSWNCSSWWVSKDHT